MNILKKYFETEAGQTCPSKSIKTIARIFYWFYLIVGVIALVGCLLAAFSIMDYNHEAGYLYLGIAVLSPVICKLIGWVTSLSLRAIAVVVESHEENLNLLYEDCSEKASQGEAGASSKEPERIFVDDEQPRKTTPSADNWFCKSCGARNPKHIGTCPDCGATK